MACRHEQEKRNGSDEREKATQARTDRLQTWRSELTCCVGEDEPRKLAGTRSVCTGLAGAQDSLTRTAASSPRVEAVSSWLATASQKRKVSCLGRRASVPAKHIGAVEGWGRGVEGAAYVRGHPELSLRPSAAPRCTCLRLQASSAPTPEPATKDPTCTTRRRVLCRALLA